MRLKEVVRRITKSNDAPLCMYPFMNILMAADGKYKPCCRWSETLSHNGRELSVSEGDSLADAWKCSEIAELREDMRRHRKNKKCSACWDEEKSGIRSMRFDSFNYGLSLSRKRMKALTPIRLDVYPSNRCNLRCRICSPSYSTGWIKEAQQTLGVTGRVFENLNQANMDQLESWLPDIKEVGLFGGEPLYNEECINLLRLMVNNGWSKDISLLINTNGTIYTEELILLFKQFKKVILNFSIDDIEKRFEYQRKGAVWSNTVKVIKKYISQGGVNQGDQLECKICCTVSGFNAYYLPELFDWVGSELPDGIRVYLNILHGPFSLSLRNVPNKLKEQITQRLTAEYLKEQSNVDGQYRTLRNIIDFIRSEPNIDQSAFLHEVQRGDRFRNETFEIIFPEIYGSISDPNNHPML